MGKSAFLQAFLGHSLGVRIMEVQPLPGNSRGQEGYHRELFLLSTQEARDLPEESPMYTINTVPVSGQEKYLIVSEGLCTVS